VGFQGSTKFLVSETIGTATYHNYNIPSYQLLLPVAKGFPNHPLEPITSHRKSDIFLGHGQTQAGMGSMVGSGKDCQKFVTETGGMVKNIPEIG